MKGPYITMENHYIDNQMLGMRTPMSPIFSHRSYKIKFEHLTSKDMSSFRTLCNIHFVDSARVYEDRRSTGVVIEISGEGSFNMFIDYLVENKLGEPHILLGLMLDRATT